jgi:hypothetical protein
MTDHHKVLSHDQWLDVRKSILAKEKQFTSLREETRSRAARASTKRRIGLSVGVAFFALAFFLILFDHRDGALRMLALVSFGFLCLATAYRLIKEIRASVV